MTSLRSVAPALAACVCLSIAAQTQPGKILPIESKVLDIAGLTLGVDARLQELGAKVVGNEIVIELAADVLFDFDKYDLKPEGRASLTKLATALKQVGKARVAIEGHTDAKGDDANNMKLSEQRANAVKNWLAKDGGIAPARLSAKGYGETRPIAPNSKGNGEDDPLGRQKTDASKFV